ncbi:4Fe-4S dicluster domain-containing protein [Dysgonomonas sp. ZJ709]|uniref:NADH-quinone oxidoreductase subunit I n=1 Tax=Dysgonomonas sp. ZJ709 TaxID=2709797 RepID=UPI0013EA9E41
MRNDEKTLLKISSRKCTGCELCAAVCPSQILNMVFLGNKECARISKQNKCIGCLSCIEICESGAIRLIN